MNNNEMGARLGTALALLLWAAQALNPVQAEAGERLQAHRVSPGDNWQRLAMDLNISVRQLKARYNPERGEGPLVVGELIWLPGERHAGPSQPSQAIKSAHVPKVATARQAKPVAPAHRARGFRIDPDPGKATAAGRQLVSHYLEQGVGGLRESGWAPLRYMQVSYRLPLFSEQPQFGASSLIPLTAGQRLGWFPQYQFDYRRERITTGMGMTYQTYLTPEWVGRFNGSLDYQPSHGHQRASLGLGVVRPGFSLMFNEYLPLSDWQESGRQRPASGRDLRAEAALPFVPSLSLVGSYYDWQGRGLTLFGAGDAYAAASAVDVGLRFQPFSSLSFAWDQHHNSKGRSAARWWLNLNLSLSGDWRQWFDQVLSINQSDLCQPFLRQGVMVLQGR